MMATDHQEIDGSWQVEIVSGFVYLCYELIHLGELECKAFVKVMCFILVCSNYDQWYYKKRYHVPTDSSPDPEDHPYGPGDPWALPY